MAVTLQLVRLVFLIGIISFAGVSVIAWWNRHKPGVIYFLCYTASYAVVMTTDVVEFSTSNPAIIDFTQKFSGGFGPALPIMWFLFVIGYLGYNSTVPKAARLGTIGGALALPVLFVVFPGPFIEPGTKMALGTVIADSSFGPATQVIGLLSFTATIAGILLLLRSSVVSNDIPTHAAALLILGILFPVFGGLLELSELIPQQLPISRMMGVLTALLFGLFFRVDNLFNVLPATRRTGLRTAFEDLHVGVIVADNGTVVLCNDAASEYLDIDREEVLGEPVEEALGLFREAVTGETPLTVERDGVAYEVTRSAAGVGGHTYLIQDVTMRQERLELQRKNERLDKFASIISHDLRNPLNAAQLRLDLLRREKTDEHIDEIEGSLDRMQSMIEDLLTLSRAGGTIEDPQQVSLAELARESWGTVTTDGAELTMQVPEDATLLADADRLRHVFENLFRNAVDHNDSPLTVKVGLLDASDTTTDDDHRGGFFIEDDGDGIPEDEHDDIFSHGYTTNDDGSGFGLSIVEDVVEAHGWTISIAESHEGGARFEITGVEVSDRSNDSWY
jgi:signal transduction histidine kinase